MIAQILTDPAQYVNGFDTKAAQYIVRANAGELKKLWRIKRASRQDDLTSCTNLFRLSSSSAPHISHA
jgi:hypothetical protein